MTNAKCTRCGAFATGNSLEDARNKINHAIGLSRGIPCGDNYNCVVTVANQDDESPPDASPTTKTESASYKKVTAKSAKNIKLDESKDSKE